MSGDVGIITSMWAVSAADKHVTKWEQRGPRTCRGVERLLLELTLSWRRLMNSSCGVGVGGSSSRVSESQEKSPGANGDETDATGEDDGRGDEGRSWARKRGRGTDRWKKRSMRNKRIILLDKRCPSNRLVLVGWLVAGLEAGWEWRGQKHEITGAEQHMSQAAARAAQIVHALLVRTSSLLTLALSSLT